MKEESIVPILKISKHYDFNQWVLFNDFKTKPDSVTFNRFVSILESTSNLSEFSKLGQIEDNSLIDQITKWASKERHFEKVIKNRDSNGNTLYHYLALGSRINLDKTNQYLKVFKAIIDKDRFDLLTMKNNKGWTPIDILSYIPSYPKRIFLEKLEGIRDLFKILINFYTKFSGDMKDHKIILTRYLICLRYTNIRQEFTKKITNSTTTKKIKTFEIFNLKEVHDLINILNSKLTNPKYTFDMLYSTYKNFNLHEYLTVFGQIAKSNIDSTLDITLYSPVYYTEIDGIKQLPLTDKHRLFDLSNKTTLNYIPQTPIKCEPELTTSQFNRLGPPVDHVLLFINDIKSFHNIVRDSFLPDEILIDPVIQKMEQEFDSHYMKDQDKSDTLEVDYLMVPDISDEDLGKESVGEKAIGEQPDTGHSILEARTKYLVNDKNYVKLYFKYKQKYIKLKNNLENFR